MVSIWSKTKLRRAEREEGFGGGGGGGGGGSEEEEEEKGLRREKGVLGEGEKMGFVPFLREREREQK